MSRGKFKGEFIFELMYFSTIVNRDLRILTKDNNDILN